MKKIKERGRYEFNKQNYQLFLEAVLGVSDIPPLTDVDISEIYATVLKLKNRDDANMLISLFGLAGEKVRASDIATARSCTRSNIHRLKRRAMTRIRHPHMIRKLKKFSVSLLREQCVLQEEMIEMFKRKLREMDEAAGQQNRLNALATFQSIDSIEMPIPVYNFLLKHGLTDLRSIAMKSQKEMLRLSRGGPKTVKIIRAILRRHGMDYASG